MKTENTTILSLLYLLYWFIEPHHKLNPASQGPFQCSHKMAKNLLSKLGKYEKKVTAKWYGSQESNTDMLPWTMSKYTV